MPVENPMASSQPETQTPSSRPMSSLEIGIMVGSIVFFVTMILLMFIVRGLDQRRRVKGLLRHAEDGNADGKEELQTTQENSIAKHAQHEPVKHRFESLWGKIGTNVKNFLCRLGASQNNVDKGMEASCNTNTNTNTKAGQTS
ncbi:hypothetical protein FHETE_437 [Fusarium heterosporum]|uniref:Transmembrane protein n=1 Tax=Fusarium heterosporum TaxID=42747 RepID=A0A8H5WYG4_FUSHE|nr:hypothetical protein FHETE_437 [Fusarium heterosporum]